MPRFKKGDILQHKIAGYQIIVEKDKGERVEGCAILSNGQPDTRFCNFPKQEFVQVKE